MAYIRALFADTPKTIRHAIDMERLASDNPALDKLEVIGSFGDTRTTVYGDAQSVMYVIGRVAGVGHDSLLGIHRSEITVAANVIVENNRVKVSALRYYLLKNCRSFAEVNAHMLRTSQLQKKARGAGATAKDKIDAREAQRELTNMRNIVRGDVKQAKAAFENLWATDRASLNEYIIDKYATHRR